MLVDVILYLLNYINYQHKIIGQFSCNKNGWPSYRIKDYYDFVDVEDQNSGR